MDVTQHTCRWCPTVFDVDWDAEDPTSEVYAHYKYGHSEEFEAAAKGLRDSTIYEFNFDNDTWEVME